MAFRPITNRAELVTYLKSQLGNPGHDIEVTPDQYTDIVNDTLQKFTTYAYDGNDEFFEELQLVKDQVKYTLDDSIIGVIKIIGQNFNAAGNSVALQQFYENTFNYNYTFSSDVILNVQLAQSHMNQLEDNVANSITYSFNSTTKELFVFSVPQDKKVLLHSLRNADGSSADFDNLYNHEYIKLQATGLAYLQWYRNMLKYDAALWDGNINVNLALIKQESDETLEKAEILLRDVYSNSFGLIYR